jgi:hypothetical protein
MSTLCSAAAQRALLLNEGFYCGPDYGAPSPLPLETHDFLWFIVGEGVIVVHCPSLFTTLACLEDRQSWFDAKKNRNGVYLKVEISALHGVAR